MLKFLNTKLRRLFSCLRCQLCRCSKSQLIVKRFQESSFKPQNDCKYDFTTNASAPLHPNSSHFNTFKPDKSIRIVTFNAAMFSMAPAVPSFDCDKCKNNDHYDVHVHASKESFDTNFQSKSVNRLPRSILKQSTLHSKQDKFSKSKLRVSINLPDNEISMLKNRQLSFNEGEKASSSSTTIGRILREKTAYSESVNSNTMSNEHNTSVVQVLRELDADILALQDVKAEEENAMKPLSDLAAALEMHYVFAESWAPEFGNAVLSKWPITRSNVQKILDDNDIRNVLKTSIEVPAIGEVKLDCTHLDHLDEKWRMKQINSILESDDQPHILAGSLNSLDETDYSIHRWTDIVKYYEEIGKPTPKVEVMKYLKSKEYKDAKEFAGECESVVVIAKGQSVQGTCKYGTRVDYILGTSNSPLKFVAGSYSVVSSKGTSDHHIVKVDVIKESCSHTSDIVTAQQHQLEPQKHGLIRILNRTLF